ncbi:hypothetical protein MML48_9g00003664 [Holotrichia oblita]|uniref:Uncharacterized protein n=1 Tax=Holotrichia oblita TaxID=644536 RepID=A0ACB9SNV6_HOLOL|nr:hypothetical protein MML48_9g00003664 [Holotrichia oblita]
MRVTARSCTYPNATLAPLHPTSILELIGEFLMEAFLIMCSLSEQLENNTLHVPESRSLPGRNKKVTFVAIADDAFAMRPYIMKPYPFRNLHGTQRIYNYGLSRARRVIENVFGIISARFRLLRKTIELEPKKISIIVSAICVLHNFLMSRLQRIYVPGGSFDTENHENGTIQTAEWRQQNYNLTPIQSYNRNLRGNTQATDIQLEFFIYISY